MLSVPYRGTPPAAKTLILRALALEAQPLRMTDLRARLGALPEWMRPLHRDPDAASFRDDFERPNWDDIHRAVLALADSGLIQTDRSGAWTLTGDGVSLLLDEGDPRLPGRPRTPPSELRPAHAREVLLGRRGRVFRDYLPPGVDAAHIDDAGLLALTIFGRDYPASFVRTVADVPIPFLALAVGAEGGSSTSFALLSDNDLGLSALRAFGYVCTRRDDEAPRGWRALDLAPRDPLGESIADRGTLLMLNRLVPLAVHPIVAPLLLSHILMAPLFGNLHSTLHDTRCGGPRRDIRELHRTIRCQVDAAIRGVHGYPTATAHERAVALDHARGPRAGRDADWRPVFEHFDGTERWLRSIDSALDASVAEAG